MSNERDTENLLKPPNSDEKHVKVYTVFNVYTPDTVFSKTCLKKANPRQSVKSALSAFYSSVIRSPYAASTDGDGIPFSEWSKSRKWICGCR